LRDAVGSGAGLGGLDFAGVDLADDAPGGNVDEREGKDEDDDDPSAGAAVGVHALGGVEASDNEHAARQADAAGNNGGSSAPAVGVEGGGDGDGEHEDGGYAGCEEGGGARG